MVSAMFLSGAGEKPTDPLVVECSVRQAHLIGGSGQRLEDRYLVKGLNRLLS